MSTLNIPNPIESFTPADAVEVDQNYQFIREYINQNCIVKDGALAMTEQLTLDTASPTQDQHAASKGYVDAFMPIGVILPYGGQNPPQNWLACDGSTKQIADYEELHSVLLARYGTAPAGSFKLPDLRGRMMVGMKSSEDRFSTTGKTGGSWVLKLPQHLHKMDHNHPSATTANETQNHQHPIDHQHATTTTADAGIHHHSGEFTSPSVGTGAGYVARRAVSDAAAGVSAQVTTDAGEHKHTYVVPKFDGNSFSQTARHNHTFDVPNFVGNTANTGEANAEHLPPFQVVFFIIRAK